MPPPPPIRLVTFDALYTLLRPSQPIHLQYTRAFEPFFGSLDPNAVKRAFKQALAHVQRDRPSYAHGHRAWWAAVIRHCALAAGAPPPLVARHLDAVTDSLLRRFSSDEGYALYPDAVPTLTALKQLGVRSAVVTNADTRIHQVLRALRLAPPHLAFALTSEEARAEKPDPRIFRAALLRAASPSASTSVERETDLTLDLRLKTEKEEKEWGSGQVRPEEALHVGDELVCDYEGARAAGMHALLLRRPSGSPSPSESQSGGARATRSGGSSSGGDGGGGGGEEKGGGGGGEGADPRVRVIESLDEVVAYVRASVPASAST